MMGFEAGVIAIATMHQQGFPVVVAHRQIYGKSIVWPPGHAGAGGGIGGTQIILGGTDADVIGDGSRPVGTVIDTEPPAFRNLEVTRAASETIIGAPGSPSIVLANPT